MNAIKSLLLTTGLIVGLPLLASSMPDVEKTPLTPIWRADVLLGTNVVSENGMTFGKITDIVVRAGSESSYAIVALGPWNESKMSLRALPWTILRTDGAEKTHDESKRSLVFTRSREVLLEAPGFTVTTWPDMSDPTWNHDIDVYYGVTPEPRKARGTVEASAAKKVMTWKMSDLIGSDVVNAEADELGEIEDVAIDSNGRLNYVALSVGGFLGIGEKHVAVPFESLAFTRGTDDPSERIIALDCTKELLEKAPEFKPEATSRHEMADSNWIAGVHAHFACPPYWKIEAQKPASPAPKK